MQRSDSENIRFPRVSIFLPTYNQEDYVVEAIESAVTQDYPNLMVVIGDDGSTDGTLEIIQKYVAQYPDRVKAVADRSHLGIAGNFHRLLKECDGDYVAIHAGDDVFLPGKITAQVAWFQKDENRVLCGHEVNVVDAISGELIEHRQVSPPPEDGAIEPWLWQCQYSPGSIMIRSTSLPAGGIDRRLATTNDRKLFIDCIKEGGAWGHVNGIYSLYRKTPNSVTVANRMETLVDNFVLWDIHVKEFPQFAPAIRRHAGMVAYWLGRESYLTDDRVGARKFFWMAFCKGRSFHAWYLICLIIAFFPEGILGTKITGRMRRQFEQYEPVNLGSLLSRKVFFFTVSSLKFLLPSRAYEYIRRQYRK